MLEPENTRPSNHHHESRNPNPSIQNPLHILNQINMALVKRNLLTMGVSGKIGGQIVFRQVGNRTVVAMYPKRRAMLSPAQQKQNEVFQKAAVFAKTMLPQPRHPGTLSKESIARGVVQRLY